jgi:predicted Zn-dependent protease
MRRALIAVLAILSLGTATGCFQKVEGTGRTQLVLPQYTDAEMAHLGTEAYQDTLSKEKRSTDADAIALLERVGRRLAAAAPDRHFQYEFTLLDSPTINAFCLPGGKVAVYTGILGYCKNEAGLAAVLGHEIAHAIANHGAERMSQGVLVNGAQTALDTYLQAKGMNASTLTMGMAAFGMASQVGVLLPFSRKHESEADYLGLTYMAKAGYDPAEAVLFWQRFSTLGGGGQPAWLSTHPASAARASDLKAHLGEANRLYAAAPEKHGAGEAVPARYLAK